MVKETKYMLNHLNLIALSNYCGNSQTDTITYSSKLSSGNMPSHNMALLKSSTKVSSAKSCNLLMSNNMHPHQYRNGHQSSRIGHNSCSIYEVYSNNLMEGSRLIRHLTKTCDIVAIDTEFPGVVCRINGEYSSTTTLAYHNIKCNTDLMKPIQIGFSFFTQNGQQSEINATVQFNLKWDMDTEVFAEDSIVLLESCGIDFNEHKQHGIEIYDFAEVFLTSGLPLNDKIMWIGFHCAYDWAYMLKICTNMPDMPQTYEQFNELLLLYFPKTIDIKTIMTDKNLRKSGLQDLAQSLKVDRIGAQHQAGSDAKLTGDTFFAFSKVYCNGVIEEKYINQIYGLNYCTTSGANMLWLPNQSPTPDDIDTHMNQTPCLKHCRSLNLVTSSIKDNELAEDLFCCCRHHQNTSTLVSDCHYSISTRKAVSSNSSCGESEGRSSRESGAQSQNDSLDES